jgi:hypothetical protein
MLDSGQDRLAISRIEAPTVRSEADHQVRCGTTPARSLLSRCSYVMQEGDPVGLAVQYFASIPAGVLGIHNGKYLVTGSATDQTMGRLAIGRPECSLTVDNGLPLGKP